MFIVGIFFISLFIQNAPAPPVGDALRCLFNDFDKDGNGYLDRDEIRNLFLVLGRRIDDREIEQDFGTSQVTFATLLGTLSTPKYENTLMVLMSYSLRRLFDQHDQDRDGLLDKEGLKGVMQKLGFVRSDADIDNIFGTQPVTFEHFSDTLASPEYMNAKITSSGSRDVGPLKDLFHRFDKDHSDTLNIQELKGIMRELGFVLSDQRIEDIFGKGNRPVDFDHFIEKVHAPPSVAEILGTTLTKYLKQQFDKFDTNRIGVLEFPQLRAVLNNLDIKISDQEITRDFRLDTDVVTFDKFKEVMALKFKDLMEIPWDVKATMMFEQLDRNHDGILSPKELADFATAVGYHFVDGELEAEYDGIPLDVDMFKRFLRESNGDLVVESEDDLMDRLVRTCDVMAHGEDRFTKLDVINYFNQVVHWKVQDRELNEIFADKTYWTFDDCMKYMKAHVKYTLMPIKK